MIGPPSNLVRRFTVRAARHPRADGINGAGHLMTGDAGVLNSGPETLFHQRIAVAHAARLLDAPQRGILGRRVGAPWRVLDCIKPIQSLKITAQLSGVSSPLSVELTLIKV